MNKQILCKLICTDSIKSALPCPRVQGSSLTGALVNLLVQTHFSNTHALNFSLGTSISSHWLPSLCPKSYCLTLHFYFFLLYGLEVPPIFEGPQISVSSHFAPYFVWFIHSRQHFLIIVSVLKSKDLISFSMFRFSTVPSALVDSKYIFVMNIMRAYLCAQTPGSHGLVTEIRQADRLCPLRGKPSQC